MPNWKKLIVSGSDASLNNLTVNNAVTASFFKGDGSGLTNVTANVAEVSTVSDTFSSVTSKTVTHNFGTKNVIVSIYDNSDQFILPASITTTDNNTVDVTFDSVTTGRVVVAKGGHIVSGSAFDSNALEGQAGSYYLDYTNFTNIPSGIVSGSAFTGSFLATGHILPDTNVTYDIGSATHRFRDLYLSGSTIDLGGTKISRDADGNVGFSDSVGTLKSLRVAELEVGSGAKKIKLKVENNKLRFEDTDTSADANTYRSSITGLSSYTIAHNLDEDYPVVQVYGTDKKQVIPGDITSSNANTVILSFDSVFNGTVVVKK